MSLDIPFALYNSFPNIYSTNTSIPLQRSSGGTTDSAYLFCKNMMICPQCLSQATGRVLVTGSLLKWRTNSFQSSTKFLRGGLSATADGRIPSRSYHRSASLAANQPLQPSTPTAHPSSTPTATSSVAEGVIATKTRPRGRKASCVPAGMPLKGISYLKNGSDPIAEADSEYPSWLWACLDEQGKGNETDERVGDLYCV